MVKRIKTGKIDVFLKHFDVHNSKLNKKGVAVFRKNVGLWLEFVLFGS